MPDAASSTTSATTSTKTTSKDSVPADGPPTDRWRVRLSHPRDNRRTVFSASLRAAPVGSWPIASRVVKKRT